MNHESPSDADEDREHKAATPRRRGRIIDLAYGIVAAALLVMALRAALDSGLDEGRVVTFCLLTPLLLAVQAGLWRLEVLAARDGRPRGRIAAILTFAGASIALFALLAMASLSPVGAAFGILACIVFALLLRDFE